MVVNLGWRWRIINGLGLAIGCHCHDHAGDGARGDAGYPDHSRGVADQDVPGVILVDQIIDARAHIMDGDHSSPPSWMAWANCDIASQSSRIRRCSRDGAM